MIIELSLVSQNNTLLLPAILYYYNMQPGVNILSSDPLGPSYQQKKNNFKIGPGTNKFSVPYGENFWPVAKIVTPDYTTI
jgi:hypothetical protein